jgi:dolichyl-phosphate-mannose--protein O-mannosyl transferase
MNTTDPRVRFLIIAGYIAMLIGAIDPMEGSLLILPGSGLVALGVFLNDEARCILIYRLLVFLLIILGVAAIWGFTLIGGVGGNTAYSMWWALLIVPYPIGWSMAIWGPDSPRWVLWAGIAIGLFYQVLLGIVLVRSVPLTEAIYGAFFISAIGLLTIAGCIYRLKNPYSVASA